MKDNCNEMKNESPLNILLLCGLEHAPFKVVFLEDETNMLTSGVTVTSRSLCEFAFMFSDTCCCSFRH